MPTERQRSPWDIDGYELHAHPDLVERLQELGEGSQRSMTPQFGIPVLVRPGGRAFALAVGMSTLIVRVDEKPEDLVGATLPSWFSEAGWIAIDAWRTSTERLRAVVQIAFDQAQQ